MTPAPRVMPRRTVLAVSGTAVLAAAAACSSNAAEPAASTTSAAASSSKASSAVGSAAAGAPAPATTAAAAPTAADSTTVTSAAAPTGTPLAAVADVESAGSLIVNAAAGPVLLASNNGTVVAHTAVCTHQQCTIAASGSCPCHGSKFNITTGAVENGPAKRPLDEITVTVSGGQVYAS